MTSNFYKYTTLPVIRWVKLSLNFELLNFPYQLLNKKGYLNKYNSIFS